MTRFARILTSSSAVAAPPPESVALESDFVVILAALLCALICVVGLIAAVRCACRPRVISIASQPSANKGLKKKVLQSLPKFTYTTASQSQHSQKMKDGDDECGSSSIQVKVTTLSTDCVICLDEFVEGDEIRVLPQCGHAFHVACIDTWLGSHSSCPSCRQILVVERCQKCGQFPAAMPMYGGCGAVGEARLKARQDGCANVNDPSFLP